MVLCMPCKQQSLLFGTSVPGLAHAAGRALGDASTAVKNLAVTHRENGLVIVLPASKAYVLAHAQHTCVL